MCLPALCAIHEDAENIAPKDSDIDLEAETSNEWLAGFADPSINLMTVIICHQRPN